MKTYQVWAYKRFGLFPGANPNGWDVQCFTTKRDAMGWAKDLQAEEVYVEVYRDGRWVNDAIEQVYIKRIAV